MAAHDYFDYFVDEPSIQDELDAQIAENNYAERVSPGYSKRKNKNKPKVIWSGNDSWEATMAKAKKLAKEHGYADIIRGEHD